MTEERNKSLEQYAPCRIIGNMRFRQPAILHGLPRGIAISGDAPKREFPEHLSLDLVKEFARNGRSLEEVYGEHVKTCRDCNDFFMEFCLGEKRLAKAQ